MRSTVLGAAKRRSSHFLASGRFPSGRGDGGEPTQKYQMRDSDLKLLQVFVENRITALGEAERLLGGDRRADKGGTLTILVCGMGLDGTK